MLQIEQQCNILAYIIFNHDSRGYKMAKHSTIVYLP